MRSLWKEWHQSGITNTWRIPRPTGLGEKLEANEHGLLALTRWLLPKENYGKREILAPWLTESSKPVTSALLETNKRQTTKPHWPKGKSMIKGVTVTISKRREILQEDWTTTNVNERQPIYYVQFPLHLYRPRISLFSFPYVLCLLTPTT